MATSKFIPELEEDAPLHERHFPIGRVENDYYRHAVAEKDIMKRQSAFPWRQEMR